MRGGRCRSFKGWLGSGSLRRGRLSKDLKEGREQTYWGRDYSRQTPQQTRHPQGRGAPDARKTQHRSRIWKDERKGESKLGDLREVRVPGDAGPCGSL